MTQLERQTRARMRQASGEVKVSAASGANTTLNLAALRYASSQVGAWANSACWQAALAPQLAAPTRVDINSAHHAHGWSFEIKRYQKTFHGRDCNVIVFP